MPGDDRTNYGSIESGRWKKIKKDPPRMIAYNNRAKQIKDDVEKVKTTKSGDDQHDPLVGCMVQHEEMMADSFVVKKYRHNPRKTPKS